MQARMKNPAMLLPSAGQAVYALQSAIQTAGVDQSTLGLVHLRVSQINGCSACVLGGARHLKKAGETDDRLASVAVWRDSPDSTDAERAALDLAEAATRRSDATDPVPDEIWNEAVRHFEEPALAALILTIALANFYNRLNVTTRQPAGAW